MGLNNLGLGMVITAKDLASATFRRVGRSMAMMRASAQKVGAGVAMLGTATRQAAMGFLPFTAAIGFGIAKAAGFEKQMNAVRSVMKGANESFSELSAEAKRVGLKTSLSAQEAAEGFELLGRAGFNAKQSITALEPIVRAAEADELSLARTTEIVTDSLNAMGEGTDQAGRFADILALTSARTATNINQLGEGLKFAAPIARGLGLTMEDTSLALGLIANSGLKAGLGGTALKNMLVKLAKPSSAAKTIMKDLGITFQTAEGNMLPFKDVVGNLVKAVPEMGGNMEKTSKLMELFGLRGQGGADALVQGFTKLANETLPDGTNGLQALIAELDNASGAATKMSETRLKGLSGALTILGGTIETVTITAFEPLLPVMEEVAIGATKSFNEVGLAIGLVFDPSDEAKKKLEQLDPTAQSIAKGVKDAFTLVKEVLASVKTAVIDLGGAFGLGGDEGVRTFTKFAVAGAMLLAVLGPIALLFTLVGMVVAPIISVFTGLSMIVSGLASGLWTIATAIYGAVAPALAALAAKASAAGTAAATSAAGGIKAMATSIYGMAKAAWASGVASLRALATRIAAAGAAALAAAGRGITALLLGIARVGAMSVGQAASGLATFALNVARAGAAAAAAAARGIAAWVAGMARLAIASAVQGAQALASFTVKVVAAGAASVAAATTSLPALVAGFYRTGAAAAASAVGGIASWIARMVTVAATSIASAVAGVSGGFAGMGAAAAAAAIPILAFTAAIGSLMLAADQLGKLMDEWDGDVFWREVKSDLGLISQAEKEKQQGIVQGEEFDRQQAKKNAKRKLEVQPPSATAPPTTLLASPAAAAGGAPAPATAADIASAVGGVDMQNNITMTTELTLDGQVLATQVDKIVKANEARGGGT